MNPWIINDSEFLDWLREIGVDITRLSNDDAEVLYDEWTSEDYEYWYDD